MQFAGVCAGAGGKGHAAQGDVTVARLWVRHHPGVIQFAFSQHTFEGIWFVFDISFSIFQSPSQYSFFSVDI